MRFGVASAPGTVGGNWVLEADGALVLPEGAKRGVIQITDAYGNEYSVDLDAPTDPGMTEDTTELYAKIDRVFKTLTDAEFQRLSTLSKADRSAEIEKIVSNRIAVKGVSETGNNARRIWGFCRGISSRTPQNCATTNLLFLDPSFEDYNQFSLPGVLCSCPCTNHK